MNRIQLLSEQVANQIAAGEVVERPASVVKELVENALDAQATRVTVEVQGGGRSLIRVTDDGTGMSRDDALLCLERHATSKIRRAEDLAAVVTMGFRGEAIPSIASVSRMTLTTRERDSAQPEATQVVIHGGRIIDVKAAGSPPGTAIEVRQLFFNLPARRKFLRSEETEYAHVHHYLTLAALAHPQVAFTFVKEGRTIWQLPSHAPAQDSPAGWLKAVRERMEAVMGGEKKLIPVDFATVTEWEEPTGEERAPSAASAPFRVWGWIGQPGVSRSTREDQHLFVNRRPVENRALNFALLEGYHTALMKGAYPVCCLFVEMNPSLVDVNIHPAKREVKFHQERAVRAWVAQAVREALMKFHDGGPVAAASPGASAARSLPILPPPAAATLPAGAPRPSAPSHSAESPPALSPRPRMGDASSLGAPAAAGPVQTSLPMPASALSSLAALTLAPPAAEPRPAASVVAPIAPGLPLLNVPLRLVGVIGRLYVVLESDRGLVLLDQHAAHERILFEQMLTRLEQGQVPSQRLLLPETVELSVRDALFLREQLPVLTRLGVGLSEFGERTFLLDALPPMVRAREPRRFVLELVDALKSAGTEVNSQRLGEHTIAKTVCRHAVKANDPLTGPELENLVQDLRRCAMPYTCPHGRPTLIEMNYRELEKKFGRQQ